MSIWLIIYLLGIVPFAILAGKNVYDGPRQYRPGLFRAGNKRSATLLGIFWGLMWPTLVVMILLGVIVVCVTDWVKAGAK